VAATYDHSVTVRSLDHRHEVAFFAIEDTLAVSPQLSREIQNALESTRGVDSGTARMSPDGTSLSFAYDRVIYWTSEIVSPRCRLFLFISMLS
jgi:hypothetical protein